MRKKNAFQRRNLFQSCEATSSQESENRVSGRRGRGNRGNKNRWKQKWSGRIKRRRSGPGRVKRQEVSRLMHLGAILLTWAHRRRFERRSVAENVWTKRGAAIIHFLSAQSRQLYLRPPESWRHFAFFFCISIHLLTYFTYLPGAAADNWASSICALRNGRGRGGAGRGSSARKVFLLFLPCLAFLQGWRTGFLLLDLGCPHFSH